MSGGLRIFVVLASLFLAQQAWGRGGVGGSAGGLKNPNSLTGLCTQENSSQRWVKQGWCKTITESLSKGCGQQKLESIRNKVANGQISDMKEYCPSVQSMASDREAFTQFMTQLVAALTIEESDWRENIKPSSMGAKGLMQLSYSSVKQKAYSCGCSSIRSDADVSRDHHKNVRCGSFIAIHWIDRDNVVGQGSGNKGSRGAARYFQPFRDIDRKKRARIRGKLSNYCNQRDAGKARPVPGESATIAYYGPEDCFL